jgi:hypothetical protein
MNSGCFLSDVGLGFENFNDDIYSDNIFIVADREFMIFNFHFVRDLSAQKNDSVIKISLWKDSQQMEFFVNNLEVRTKIVGSRLFNENNFFRFVLTGECSSLYIQSGFAIIE